MSIVAAIFDGDGGYRVVVTDRAEDLVRHVAAHEESRVVPGLEVDGDKIGILDAPWIVERVNKHLRKLRLNSWRDPARG